MLCKSVIKKEILDGVRNYRFLIVFASTLFFAVFNPVMQRFVLPELLKSQFSDLSEEMLHTLVITSQVEIVQGYLGDVAQIGALIISLVLAGLVAGELQDRTFFIPVSSGKRYHSLVVAKLMVYSVVLVASALVSLTVNYLHAGLFFGFELQSMAKILPSGLMLGLYLVFLLSMLLLVGTVTKKAISTGLIVYFGVSVLGALTNLLDVPYLVPVHLVSESMQLGSITGTTVATGVLTVMYIGAAAVFTVRRLNTMDMTIG